MASPRYRARKRDGVCVQCGAPARVGRVRCDLCCCCIGVSRVMYERISRAADVRGIARTQLVELALADLPEAP